jgi:hypothetical protein
MLRIPACGSLSLATLLVMGGGLLAEPAGKLPEIKAAVDRALPLLWKGAEGHMAHRTCFACHNQAIPILAFTIAREHGCPLRAEDLKKQLDFIATFLGQNRANYLQGKGQGGQADTAAYALLALELGGWQADETTMAVVEYLLQFQNGQDHWHTTSNRPPSEASDFTVNYLALRALRQWGAAGQKDRIAQRIASVRRWLLKTPARDTEDRVFRLWGLQAAGAGDNEVRLAVRELAQSQDAEGGWAQTEDMDSDAYATGSALVALHQAGGLATSDPVYQRGVAFLLEGQHKDGSWLVRSRSKPFQTYFESGFPHGKDQFISMAATGWAAAALALALPPPVKQAPKQRAVEPLIDLSQAVVLAVPGLSGPEMKAHQMLVEEVNKRSHAQWERQDQWPTGNTPVILIGQGDPVRAIAARQGIRLSPEAGTGGREGYSIGVERAQAGPVVWIAGNDVRGVLFGVGHLLRTLRIERAKISLPSGFRVQTAPQTALRGHQLGYRPKTNSYDGWTVAMWEQYIRDLVIFGVNAIELIPPRSDDDADSPHFPAPPLRMMTDMSRLADAYGIDVWVWYPAMDRDYSDPKTVEFALQEWGAVFRALPRLDAVFVPGGDPGHTQPRVLFDLLEKQTANLHRYHPRAQMWMSPQSFTQPWMDEFFALIRKEPAWLTGLVHGPQVRIDLSALRAATPARYPIRDYPDITHSRHCQFPVPEWDLAFAITQGREVSNPRPLGMAQIYHHDRPHSVGFLTYSEGCHDDVNKCVWSALGWNEQADLREVLHDYSRYFIGPGQEDQFADGLFGLEKNWEGPVLANTGIDATFQKFQTMEKTASPSVKRNWRFQQALYRAYYDAYVRARLLYETDLETKARAHLQEARRIGALRAMAEADAILDRAIKQPTARELRARLFELAEALFQSIHMQLSVPRYQAIAVERGANLDQLDLPLTEAGWLKQQFTAVRALDDEAARLAFLDKALHRTDPGPGGFYDDLGDPGRQPHLVRGVSIANDPASYASSLVGFAFRDRGPNPARPRAWWTHAESLYDAPLKMYYPGLDRNAFYRLRVVYSGERRSVKIRLVARERIEIHDYLHRPFEPLEFALPREATANGELLLSWAQEPGAGGAGRGCQVAEVWLLKEPGKK